jgi:hypothetical protein
MRPVRSLLLALALLLAQCAAQAHAISHIDPAVAGTAGHPAERCIAFHAVDSVLAGTAFAVEPVHVTAPTPAHVALPLARPAIVSFHSRAPPVVA